MPEKVTKGELNRWLKWLQAQGYNGPLTGLKPTFPWVKGLAKELKREPPTILETRPRDARTIASNLNRYASKMAKKPLQQTESLERLEQQVGLALAKATEKHLDRIGMLIQKWSEHILTLPIDRACRPSAEPIIPAAEEDALFGCLRVGHLPEVHFAQLWSKYDSWKEDCKKYVTDCKKQRREIWKLGRSKLALRYRKQEGVTRRLTSAFDEPIFEELHKRSLGQQTESPCFQIVRRKGKVPYDLLVDGTPVLEFKNRRKGSYYQEGYQDIWRYILQGSTANELLDALAALRSLETEIKQQLRVVLERADYIHYPCHQCPKLPESVSLE